MHRSRIGVVLVDHPVESYDAAATFWAAAHGSARTGQLTDDDPYESLGPLSGGLLFETQRMGAGTPARVHLDIESDDVPAEVSRLEALGAAVAEQRDSYAIMVDPGGLVFCVVPVQSGDAFEAHATSWD